MEELFYYRQDASKQLLTETMNFNIDDITNLLVRMGLISDYQKSREEELERYVFLHGDSQEIYGREERQFIENAGSVYIYQEEYRKTKKGTMPCRVIATELELSGDSIRNCIFLMKVINKAVGGFNIFLFKTAVGYFVGCRLFDNDTNNDCILSFPILTEDDINAMTERLLYCYSGEEFIPYYSSLIEAIEYRDDFYVDYDSNITNKRGVQFSYIEALMEIGAIYHLNFSGEINRYNKSFSEGKPENYTIIVNNAKNELSFIKSFKANTLEMLFEAEEMVLLANKTEEENKKIISEHTINDNDEDEKMKEYLDDPEMMIKILKQRKGL